MLPLLEIGPWRIGVQPLVVTLAVLIGGVVAFERLLRLDHPPTVIARGLLLTALGGIAGVYLMLYLTNLLRIARDGPLARPETPNVGWALLGGGIAALLYVRRHKGPLGRVLDLGAPALPLAQALGRLGCVAAGCCYGKPTDSWLGLYLPDEQGYWAVRYPTQLLSLAANLLIFFTLLAVETRFFGKNRVSERRPFDGFLALLYILLFSLKRFGVGFLRENPAPLLGPFSWLHLQALAGLVLATVLIVWNLHRKKKEGKR